MSRFLGRERNKSQARQQKRLADFILKTKEEMLRNYFSQKPIPMGEGLMTDIDNVFKEHLEEKYGNQVTENSKD